MLTLTLVVLSQVAVPQAQPGGHAWATVTPLTSALGGAVASRRLAAELGAETTVQLAALAGGAVIGVLAGYAAGRLAREGHLAARIISVALYALSTGAVAYDLYRFHLDVQEVCRQGVSLRLANWGSL